MMVKEYLKKVCDLEQKKYEAVLKHEKATSEYKRVKNKSAKENDRFSKEIKEFEENKSKKIKELQDEKSKLEAEKSRRDTDSADKVLSTMWSTMVISIGAMVLIAFVVLKLFGATTASDVFFPYTLIYALLISIVYYFVKECSMSVIVPILQCLLAFAVLVFSTWGYFKLLEKIGIGLLFSNIILAVIVLVIEGIIFYNKYNNEYKEEQKWLRNYRKQCLLLDTKIMTQEKLYTDSIKEKQEKNNAYNKASTQKLAVIQKEIDANKKTITQLDVQIKAIYAQGVLHPNYQNWIAAATIYDYFDTGICYELKGPDGAYKWYEQEKNAKKIATSLDEIKKSVKDVHNCVNNKAEMLYESQRYLLWQIDAVNRKLDRYMYDI